MYLNKIFIVLITFLSHVLKNLFKIVLLNFSHI